MTDIQEKLMGWNLNTILVVAGFAGTFVTWGWAWGDVQSSIESHATKLTVIESRVSAIEVDNRRLDNHELRISNVEKRGSDTSQALRSLETTLNSLATDIKVTREILQRIEDRTEVKR